MSSFELILHGLKLSLKGFIEKHLLIESNYEVVTSFIGFLNSTNDRIINERKGELLEYFIHQFLEENGIISFINKTLVYLNKNNMPRISDGNVDLHMSGGLDTVGVPDLREFLNTISKKPETFVGFLVSNVELSDNARIELENSPIKKPENKFLRKQNKKIKDESQSQIEKLESQIIDLKEKIEIRNQDIKETFDNQSREFKEFNKKLDLIL
ncbi:2905_t:CDS:2, partial [Racocetra fulgida]